MTLNSVGPLAAPPAFAAATVGLFGTCAHSQWRKPFVEALERLSIPVFNPQLAPGAWRPELENQYVQEELYHFEHCPIVVFAITAESLSLLSLAELGFCVAHLLENQRQQREQHLLVYIDTQCLALDTPAQAVKESNQMRKLMKDKLRLAAERIKNIRIFSSLERLQEAACALALNQTARKTLAKI